MYRISRKRVNSKDIKPKCGFLHTQMPKGTRALDALGAKESFFQSHFKKLTAIPDI